MSENLFKVSCLPLDRIDALGGQLPPQPLVIALLTIESDCITNEQNCLSPAGIT